MEKDHIKPFFYVPGVDLPARDFGQGDFFLVSVGGFFFYNLGAAFLLWLRLCFLRLSNQLADF